MFVDFLGPARPGLIPVLPAPLDVPLHEGGLAHAPHAVHVPERCGKIHPFLCPVLPHRAVEQGGIGLIQKGDEVVLHHRLGLSVEAALPVQRFQLIANRVHGCMLTQFCPSVKGISRNFLGVGLVGLYMAQAVPAAVVLDKFRVHRADVKPSVMEILGNLLIVPPGVFHHHPRFTVQAFQVICQLFEFTAGVTHLEWLCHSLVKGTAYRHHTLALGNIDPHRVHCTTLPS